MRRRDCEFNLDISMRQQTPSDDDKMRILERRAAVAYCGHMVRHCTRASRGLVDVKQREQIICYPCF